MKLSGISFFLRTRKNFKLNLVLALVLVLKSKSIYFLVCATTTRNERRKKNSALFSTTNPASYEG